MSKQRMYRFDERSDNHPQQLRSVRCTMGPSHTRQLTIDKQEG
jgi:hypothetical protein